MSNNIKLYDTYQYRCECGTRHPKKIQKCFACAGIDTIRLDPIKKKTKVKSDIRGATVHIKF